jgi:hypothetical protein
VIDPLSAARIHSLANTPTWLFRQLRAEPAVQAAAKLPTNDLVARTRQNLAPEKKDLGNRAVGTAYLVAISYKPRREVLKALPQLEALDHPWLRELIALVLSNASTDSQITNVQFPPDVRLIDGIPVASTNQRYEVDLDPH